MKQVPIYTFFYKGGGSLTSSRREDIDREFADNRFIDYRIAYTNTFKYRVRRRVRKQVLKTIQKIHKGKSIYGCCDAKTASLELLLNCCGYSIKESNKEYITVCPKLTTPAPWDSKERFALQQAVSCIISHYSIFNYEPPERD